jgi:hypothetical protein
MLVDLPHCQFGPNLAVDAGRLYVVIQILRGLVFLIVEQL